MPKVLIIDDHKVVAESLALIFEMEGFETMTAHSGSSGLSIIREKQPDVVICDYYMPGMSGLDVLQTVREDPELAHIPVIILTMDPSVHNRARALGSDAFVTKSSSADVLLKTIDDLLC